MPKTSLVGSVLSVALVLVAGLASFWFLQRALEPPDVAPTASPQDPGPPLSAEHWRGFLFGRVTAVDGTVYEGRLRFGGGEEAFWNDFFNGAKRENTWAASVPPASLPREPESIRVFGLEIVRRNRLVDLGRLFMVRFGDLSRIESRGRDVVVTLKSGTVVELDRFEASDFDDGVRVWDSAHGVIDLDSVRIRSIDFSPTQPLAGVSSRLHGTVSTAQDAFTGFVQWNRRAGLEADELRARAGKEQVRFRFDTLRSIAKHTPGGSTVTLDDGREMLLDGSSDVDDGNLGVFVEDERYGRVLVSWDAFVRVDFSDGPGTGPSYDDFPPGRPLSARVTTRAGAALSGRLVFDLDESETIETLDARWQGVDFSIPFGLVATIVPGVPVAEVTLRSGETIRLEASGDLGERNAGLLVFADGAERPEYVPWADVANIWCRDRGSNPDGLTATGF